jgi:glycosyltransferase
MRVSIVTPVYNDPRLRGSLNSIQNQEEILKPEVIVVDGESTDETVEVLNDFQEFIDILISEPDDGIYDAMNKGIRRASGEIIGILNADDRYQDQYVLRDVSTRMKSTGTKTCYGDLVYVNSDDKAVRYWDSGSYRQKKIYYGWMPPHPAFFVRSGVYNQYGMFDTEYCIAADYDLMLRFLLKHDLSTSYLDRTLVRMSTGGKSNKSILNVIKSNWEVANSWKKNGLRGGSIVTLLKPLRKVSQFVNARE